MGNVVAISQSREKLDRLFRFVNLGILKGGIWYWQKNRGVQKFSIFLSFQLFLKPAILPFDASPHEEYQCAQVLRCFQNHFCFRKFS